MRSIAQIILLSLVGMREGRRHCHASFPANCHCPAREPAIIPSTEITSASSSAVAETARPATHRHKRHTTRLRPRCRRPEPSSCPAENSAIRTVEQPRPFSCAALGDRPMIDSGAANYTLRVPAEAAEKLAQIRGRAPARIRALMSLGGGILCLQLHVTFAPLRDRHHAPSPAPCAGPGSMPWAAAKASYLPGCRPGVHPGPAHGTGDGA